MNAFDEFENSSKERDAGEPMNQAVSTVADTADITYQEELYDDPDAISLRLWKNGNIKGYNDIVKRYERPLFAFIYRIIHDSDEAKDVLQETYVRFYRSLQTLREDKSIKSWLFQTANRLCIDHFRKTKPDRIMTVDHQDSTFVASIESDSAEHPDQPDACYEDRQVQAKIQDALQSLPKKQRMIMSLRTQKDLSLKEIAEIMDCSERTIGTALFAARKKLVKMLKPILEELYGRSASDMVRKGVGL